MLNSRPLSAAKKIAPGLCLAVVLIITFYVYRPGLSGPLILDDYANLFHLYNFGAGNISWQQLFMLTPHGYDRPVSLLSFIGNWLGSGGNVYYLKLTNLAIHLACGLLIYRLSWLLLSLEIIGDDLRARYVALWIAALWLLSPFLVSTVLYVIQRMAQLAALFTLAGLVAYVSGRKKFAQYPLRGGVLIATSLLICWPLAALSKENGILLPLFLGIIEYFFFFRDSDRKSVKTLRLVLAAAVAVPGLAVLAILVFDPGIFLAGYAGRHFTLYERLISEPRILLDYIGNLLLIPGASPMSLFHDDYLKSTGLLHPATTLPCLLLPLALIPFAFFTAGKKYRAAVFGLVFFYAAHLVESTFIPLELYFEHRNYLPAFGIYFSAVTGIALLLPRIRIRNTALAVLCIAPVTFSILTHQRSLDWHSRGGIYFSSAISHPDSPRVNEGLAYLYLTLNKPRLAIHYLDRVIALDPGPHAPEFYFKYLLAYCRTNKPMTAADYKKILNFRSLSNKASTVIYFQQFIDAVEAGRCDALDLNKIADQFSRAVANRDRSYDITGVSYVNSLLTRLRHYLGRDH